MDSAVAKVYHGLGRLGEFSLLGSSNSPKPAAEKHGPNIAAEEMEQMLSQKVKPSLPILVA